VNSGPTLIRMEGLSRQERAACAIAVRTLDVAVAEAWDVDGRRGVVDVLLTLTDGRRAAFEVTNLGDPDAFKTASLLACQNHKWLLPGQWVWSIEVGSFAAMQRLRKCYQNIIQICEAVNVEHPETSQLAWGPSADPDLRWLVEASGCSMIGHSDLSSQGRDAMVVPASPGGWVDDSLTGFADELRAAFQAAHITEHFEKLRDEPNVDEHQLFIPLHDTALPAALSAGLTFGKALPSAPPPVPNYLDYLWLAPAYSPRVLLWSAEGWRNVPNT
jgi:hypothetical protein